MVHLFFPVPSNLLLRTKWPITTKSRFPLKNSADHGSCPEEFGSPLSADKNTNSEMLRCDPDTIITTNLFPVVCYIQDDLSFFIFEGWVSQRYFINFATINFNCFILYHYDYHQQRLKEKQKKKLRLTKSFPHCLATSQTIRRIRILRR